MSNLITSDAEIFNTGFIWVAVAAIAWVTHKIKPSTLILVKAKKKSFKF